MMRLQEEPLEGELEGEIDETTDIRISRREHICATLKAVLR